MRSIQLDRTISMRRRGGSPIVNPISGTAPVLAALAIGDDIAGKVTWGSYGSTAGTINEDTAREMQVDAGAWVPFSGAITAALNEQWTVRETPEDSATNTRTFTSLPITVGYGAITASGTVPAQEWEQDEAITTINMASYFSGNITAYAVHAGTLPPGVSLNTSTGAITGTPTAVQAAANVTIRASNPEAFADQVISIAVVEVIVLPTATIVSENRTGDPVTAVQYAVGQVDGTLSVLVSTNATETAAAVEAGGGAASFNITYAALADDIDLSAVTYGTAYYLHALYRDVPGHLDSAVLTSGPHTMGIEATSDMLITPQAAQIDTSGTTTATFTGVPIKVTEDDRIALAQLWIRRSAGEADVTAVTIDGVAATAWGPESGTVTGKFQAYAAVLAAANGTTATVVVTTNLAPDAVHLHPLVVEHYTPVYDSVARPLLYTLTGQGGGITTHTHSSIAVLAGGALLSAGFRNDAGTLLFSGATTNASTLTTTSQRSSMGVTNYATVQSGLSVTATRHNSTGSMWHVAVPIEAGAAL